MNASADIMATALATAMETPMKGRPEITAAASAVAELSPGRQGDDGSELELVGQSAQELGGRLRRLGVGMTAGPVALLDALEQPDQVLDDADHLLGLLALGLAAVLGHRRWGVQHLHLVRLLALATREDPELDPGAGLERGDSLGQRGGADVDVVPVLA